MTILVLQRTRNTHTNDQEAHEKHITNNQGNANPNHMSYHLTPKRMIIINKNKKQVLVRL
jgi:hypothetical protein